MSDLPTRYRTRTKDGELRLPPRRMDYGNAFALMPSTVHRLLAQKAARDNVRVATEDRVRAQLKDDPFTGQIVVMERDERATKPMFLADLNGSVPVIAMGDGYEHWQDLKDRVDEWRHYGYDTISRDEIPAPNAQEVWTTLVERNVRHFKGMKTFGAETKGQYTK